MRDADSVAISLECRKVGIRTAVQSNNCEVQTVVSPKNLAVTFCGGANGKPCRTYRQRFEKITSIYHLFSRMDQYLVPVSSPD
jgi:hypothetical protein